MRVNELIAEATSSVNSAKTINQVKMYIENAVDALGNIWTLSQENNFIAEKNTYILNLQNLLDGNTYDAQEQTEVEALLNEAIQVISALNETDGFDILEIEYSNYYKKMNKVLTSAEKTVLAEKRIEAREEINTLVEMCGSEEYTLENLEKIATIQSNFETLINDSVDVEEINAYMNAALAQILAVETKSKTLLEERRTVAKQGLLSYKSEQNYAELDWRIILSIIEKAGLEIDNAETDAEIATIIAETKGKIDQISVADKQAQNSSSGCRSTTHNIVALLAGIAGVYTVFTRRKKMEGKNVRR